MGALPYWLGLGGLVLGQSVMIVALWRRSRRSAARAMRVAQSLRRQRHFQRAVFEAMPHALSVRDVQGRLVLCNAAFEELFDVARGAIIRRTLLDSGLTGSNAYAALDIHEDYLRLLDEGTPVEEERNLHVGGLPRRFLHWAVPIRMQRVAQPVGLVSGTIDVNAHHRLVELLESARVRAETASRAKSSFLATMSHEIRTPMNAVLGLLELLMRERRLSPQDRESAGLAHGAARNLLSLIDDALNLSKVEAGGLELVPRAARLEGIVREVAHVFDGLARPRGLAIEVHLDETLAPWHAVDASRFRQIVNNLVSNAIRYTDRGVVAIHLRSLGVAEEVESVILRVSDTGIGMAPDELRKIFTPFYQAASAGRRTGDGTGLGLAIVQGLCERMGGEIAADSRPGVGTSISISLRLPVLPGPDAVEGEGDAHPPSRPRFRSGRFHVLVVDDHPANRLLLQRQLDYLGMRSSVAGDGQEALALWRAGGFDMVIADCSMPVMDGCELTAQIRAIEHERQLPRCPVLGCTAHVRDGERRRALDAGMDECLTKPLDVDGLLQALQRHLPLDESGPAMAQDSAPEWKSQPAAFDLASLHGFSSGNIRLEAEFLATLLRANDGDMKEVSARVHGGAVGSAVTIAHRIKGAARIVRATRVVRACEALEAAAPLGRVEDTARALSALESAMSEFNTAISKHLQEGGSLAH